MKHSIQNNKFRVEVLEKGAELCSIKSLSTNQEYIWQADPNIWASHAPNLFPVIGCLKEDGFLYEGKEYPMTKHGFIRNNEDIQLHSRTNSSICFVLKSNENTKELYPFNFAFYIHFILEENRLIVKHDVVNTGNQNMLFCLGGHPAFNCPISKKTGYSDYYLEFEQDESANTWMIDENGLIGNEGKLILKDENRIDLHDQIFANDALIFKKLRSSFVHLKCTTSNYSLKFDISEFPYLGLWAKTNAPYVCIEPWIGIADTSDTNRELASKEIIENLAPKENFSASYSIEIIE